MCQREGVGALVCKDFLSEYKNTGVLYSVVRRGVIEDD